MFLMGTIILSQAEDRATQGCDPSVAGDPRVDGPASHCGAGLFSRRFDSRLSSSSTCGSTAINPCGPTAFRGLYKTNYPYVLGQPLATGTFSLPAARRPARHKMGMRHRTAQLLTGLAGGCPTADHRVAGLVRAQCCLRSWGLLGFRPPWTAARPRRRRIGVRQTLGPHHVDHFGKLMGDGHDRRILAALWPPLAAQARVELSQPKTVAPLVRCTPCTASMKAQRSTWLQAMLQCRGPSRPAVSSLIGASPP